MIVEAFVVIGGLHLTILVLSIMVGRIVAFFRLIHNKRRNHNVNK
jgi:hypothetical protein